MFKASACRGIAVGPPDVWVTIQSASMVVPVTSGVNGTYHAAEAQKERVRRIRLLVGIGLAVTALGMLNIVLINADMTRIEQTGPQQLALAGGGVDHFVPGILSNLQRANQPPNTVSVVLSSDPRHSPPFVDDKRALERWLALTG